VPAERGDGTGQRVAPAVDLEGDRGAAGRAAAGGGGAARVDRAGALDEGRTCCGSPPAVGPVGGHRVPAPAAERVLLAPTAAVTPVTVTAGGRGRVLAGTPRSARP